MLSVITLESNIIPSLHLLPAFRLTDLLSVWRYIIAAFFLLVKQSPRHRTVTALIELLLRSLFRLPIFGVSLHCFIFLLVKLSPP